MRNIVPRPPEDRQAPKPAFTLQLREWPICQVALCFVSLLLAWEGFAQSSQTQMPESARQLLQRLESDRWLVAYLRETHLHAFDSKRKARLGTDRYRVWMRREFAETVKIEGIEDYDGAILKTELDCREMRYKSKAATFYLRGKPVNSGTFNDQWQDILPGSVDELRTTPSAAG